MGGVIKIFQHVVTQVEKDVYPDPFVYRDVGVGRSFRMAPAAQDTEDLRKLIKLAAQSPRVPVGSMAVGVVALLAEEAKRQGWDDFELNHLVVGVVNGCASFGITDQEKIAGLIRPILDDPDGKERTFEYSLIDVLSMAKRASVDPSKVVEWLLVIASKDKNFLRDNVYRLTSVLDGIAFGLDRGRAYYLADVPTLTRYIDDIINGATDIDKTLVNMPRTLLEMTEEGEGGRIFYQLGNDQEVANLFKNLTNLAWVVNRCLNMGVSDSLDIKRLLLAIGKRCGRWCNPTDDEDSGIRYVLDDVFRAVGELKKGMFKDEAGVLDVMCLLVGHSVDLDSAGYFAGAYLRQTRVLGITHSMAMLMAGNLFAVMGSGDGMGRRKGTAFDDLTFALGKIKPGQFEAGRIFWTAMAVICASGSNADVVMESLGAILKSGAGVPDVMRLGRLLAKGRRDEFIADVWDGMIEIGVVDPESLLDLQRSFPKNLGRNLSIDDQSDIVGTVKDLYGRLNAFTSKDAVRILSVAIRSADICNDNPEIALLGQVHLQHMVETVPEMLELGYTVDDIVNHMEVFGPGRPPFAEERGILKKFFSLGLDIADIRQIISNGLNQFMSGLDILDGLAKDPGQIKGLIERYGVTDFILLCHFLDNSCAKFKRSVKNNDFIGALMAMGLNIANAVVILPTDPRFIELLMIHARIFGISVPIDPSKLSIYQKLSGIGLSDEDIVKLMSEAVARRGHVRMIVDSLDIVASLADEYQLTGLPAKDIFTILHTACAETAMSGVFRSGLRLFHKMVPSPADKRAFIAKYGAYEFVHFCGFLKNSCEPEGEGSRILSKKAEELMGFCLLLRDRFGLRMWKYYSLKVASYLLIQRELQYSSFDIKIVEYSTKKEMLDAIRALPDYSQPYIFLNGHGSPWGVEGTHNNRSVSEILGLESLLSQVRLRDHSPALDLGMELFVSAAKNVVSVQSGEDSQIDIGDANEWMELGSKFEAPPDGRPVSAKKHVVFVLPTTDWNGGFNETHKGLEVLINSSKDLSSEPARIFLRACSTGAGDENIASHLSQWLGGVWVQAPPVEVSAEIRPDDDEGFSMVYHDPYSDERVEPVVYPKP